MKYHYFQIMPNHLGRRNAAFARGIAAEPPKPTRSGGEGDGADSPTRGAERAEAARPNVMKSEE